MSGIGTTTDGKVLPWIPVKHAERSPGTSGRSTSEEAYLNPTVKFISGGLLPDKRNIDNYNSLGLDAFLAYQQRFGNLNPSNLDPTDLQTFQSVQQQISQELSSLQNAQEAQRYRQERQASLIQQAVTLANDSAQIGLRA